MPIKNRIDMLSTGIRTPVGIKILGDDLDVIAAAGVQIEKTLRRVPGTRSVYAERAAGGYYVDFNLRRESLARYGISVEDAQTVIMSAVGGEPVTTTFEGRERYTVNVRYARELRDDISKLRRVFVPTGNGAQIPLGEIADIRRVEGPSMIRNENGSLAAYVFIDVEGRDVGGYAREAKAAVKKNVTLPTGTSLVWSGQYESLARVKDKLKMVLPLTLFLIAVLLYMNTRSWIKSGIVMLAVPFSLVEALWLLYVLDYHMSIAVWVGMIALMGLDAETGVFMLLYLDMSYADGVRSGRMRNFSDLKEAVVHGAVKRIRPKMMTVMSAFMGLLPLMWSSGWDRI